MFLKRFLPGFQGSIGQALCSDFRGPGTGSHFAGRDRRRGSIDPQVFRACFAAVRDDLIADFLSLVQMREASPFDRRDMDENVLATAIRLNEAIAFCPLNHFTVPIATVANSC